MFRNDVPITPELVAQHGLKPDEYDRFRRSSAATRR